MGAGYIRLDAVGRCGYQFLTGWTASENIMDHVNMSWCILTTKTAVEPDPTFWIPETQGWRTIGSHVCWVNIYPTFYWVYAFKQGFTSGLYLTNTVKWILVKDGQSEYRSYFSHLCLLKSHLCQSLVQGNMCREKNDTLGKQRYDFLYVASRQPIHWPAVAG